MKIVVLLFSLGLFQANAAPLNILIDPGHGGRDHGTVKGDTHESDITLSVAQLLHQRLQKDRRFRASLTRTSDTHLSLNDRAQKAKDARPDVFLSIHVNSSPDARAKGAEFYFQNQLPPDEESMFLAHRENDLDAGASMALTYDAIPVGRYSPEVTSILTDLLDGDRILRSSELSKALKSAWRGTRKSRSNSVRQAPFFVLSQLAAPSTLVELGFLTNDDDYRELTTSSAQAKMADDLYQGLLRYLDER